MTTSTLKNFLADQTGQTATEYMLLISVIVIALVSSAYLFVPEFEAGVKDLAGDVRKGLEESCITGVKKHGGGVCR
jgi:Flp pilus assembly pilin Flp